MADSLATAHLSSQLETPLERTRRSAGFGTNLSHDGQVSLVKEASMELKQF